MGLPIKLLRAKAKGYTESINRMLESERRESPSEAFGDDYNAFRLLVVDARPDLRPLVPPEVAYYNAMGGAVLCHQTFAEIATFCEVIYQLLSEKVEQ